MKILHAILSEGFYGSERSCIELASAQARAGHAVELLIANDRSDSARAFRREVELTTAAIAKQGTTGTIALVIMPGWLPAMLHRAFARRALAKFSPDIVHTHLNPAGRRVGCIAQQLGIAHVATLHLDYEAREHAGCDGLIAVASWQRARIGPEFRGESAVIWNWLPAAVSAALARATPDERTALRRGWRADDGCMVFGSIGRLLPEKGMDVLVEAFRVAFPRGDEPARLAIVGDGPQRAELERRAAGDARIVLMGRVPEVAALYRAFDVYVSASRFEPFGLTILEAMDAGAPLVVTRTDGPREFLEDAPVLWAEPDDAATLAAQLRAAAARGRVRQDYDLSPFRQSRAVAAVEELYRKVLAKA